jgi:hypothetical protein
VVYVLAVVYVVFVGLQFYAAKSECLFVELVGPDADEQKRLRYIAPLRRPSVSILTVASNVLAVAIGFSIGWIWAVLLWSCRVALIVLAPWLPPSRRNMHVRYALWQCLCAQKMLASQKLSRLSAEAVAGKTEAERRALLDEAERQCEFPQSADKALPSKAERCLWCAAEKLKHPQVGAELSHTLSKWEDIQAILDRLKRLPETKA